MQADFSIELGRDDEVLEMPWAAPGGTPRYLDLKRQPELLDQVEEAQRFPELGAFLSAANARSSGLETAKCDAWSTTEINPEEEIFGAPWKFGCYVDLLFTNRALRISLTAHEEIAKRLAQGLQCVPEIPAAAEFVIRRCYEHAETGTRESFYITLYLFGYGSDEKQARIQWAIGLKLVENAGRQIFAAEQWAGARPSFGKS
jgi:hypothetical protein